MKKQIISEFIDWLKKENLSITNLNAKNTIAIYIRVSTNKQEELSPLSQLKEIYKYAIRNNFQIDINQIYVEEEGISGKHAEKRNEFQSMIAHAKSKEKEFDTIVVWKFSRFARNQEESIVYKNMLKKNNVNVVSVSEPIIDGPFGSLIERIIEWMDEYYLIRLSGEVTRGMTEAANQGRVLSTAPFGYRNENKKFVVHEEEAKIVKWIFETFVSGKMSQIEMARHINNLGFKTKRGSKFENRTISYILLNPIYTGKIRWTPNGKLTREELYTNTKSIITNGTHEAIISEELFEKARQRLKENRKFMHSHEHQTHIWHWMKGLIRCECGKTFIRTSGKLRCNGYNKGTCTVSDRIDYNEVENLILEQLKRDSTHKIAIENIVQTKKESKKTNDLEYDALKNLEKKEERIKDAYLNGIDSLTEYKNNKEKIQKEREILLQKIQKNTEKIEEDIPIEEKISENLKTIYETLTDDSIDVKKKYDIAHRYINVIIYKNGVLYMKYNDF